MIAALLARPQGLYSNTPQGFWFSHFTIGASKDLEILIDTGSADAILNPGVYEPSSGSVDTGKPFRISYATTNPDGSGTLTVSDICIAKRNSIILNLTGIWRDLPRRHYSARCQSDRQEPVPRLHHQACLAAYVSQ